MHLAFYIFELYFKKIISLSFKILAGEYQVYVTRGRPAI
jgi:hypothetical protein